MTTALRALTPLAFLCVLFIGCGDDDDGAKITGPVDQTGTGEFFPIRSVSFPARDGVEVSGLFGQFQADDEKRPVVIFVHDVDPSQHDKFDWLFFFEQIFAAGYMPLSIDLRGHGDTPLPTDDRPAELAGLLTIRDVENSYLDVEAALRWLRDQPGADTDRVAVVGDGGGGNVAFVSTGAFPQQVKAAVALSPGLLAQDASGALVQIVVGDDVEPFAPHSILFMVGEQDFLQISQTQSIGYAGFSTSLHELTTDPKTLAIIPGSDDHGLDLLGDDNAVQILLDWLDVNL